MDSRQKINEIMEDEEKRPVGRPRKESNPELTGQAVIDVSSLFRENAEIKLKIKAIENTFEQIIPVINDMAMTLNQMQKPIPRQETVKSLPEIAVPLPSDVAAEPKRRGLFG